MGVVKLWTYFLEAVFPRLCVGCGAHGELLCSSCVLRVPLEPVLVDGVWSLFSYHHPYVRASIGAHKYHGDSSGVAALLSRVDICVFLNSTFFMSNIVLVPMPLHALRERARGYNQARDIATTLGRLLVWTVDEVLKRSKLSEQLAGKSKAERAAIMSNRPFQTIGAIDSVNTYLVIDDVRTTGATLRAALNELHAAGATQIFGLTVAAADHD